MKKFDKKSFISFALDHAVIGFFDEPITLKSGRKSNWYVNWRTVSSDVFLIDQLSDFLLSFVSDIKLGCDSFFGVPEGATKLAIISTFKWAKKQPNYNAGSHALSMGRGRPKKHGALGDRYFLGEPKGRVVVLEDVTTTGESLLNTIRILREAGACVVGAISLTDRMERIASEKTIEKASEELGTKFYALTNASEILPLAVEKYAPSNEVLAAIEKEYAEFGIMPIRLEKK